MPHDLDMEPSGARLMPLRCIVSERETNESEGDRNAAVRGVEEFNCGSAVQYNARSGASTCNLTAAGVLVVPTHGPANGGEGGCWEGNVGGGTRRLWREEQQRLWRCCWRGRRTLCV
jgi:hypothetical protein